MLWRLSANWQWACCLIVHQPDCDVLIEWLKVICDLSVNWLVVVVNLVSRLDVVMHRLWTHVWKADGAIRSSLGWLALRLYFMWHGFPTGGGCSDNTGLFWAIGEHLERVITKLGGQASFVQIWFYHSQPSFSVCTQKWPTVCDWRWFWLVQCLASLWCFKTHDSAIRWHLRKEPFGSMLFRGACSTLSLGLAWLLCWTVVIWIAQACVKSCTMARFCCNGIMVTRSSRNSGGRQAFGQRLDRTSMKGVRVISGILVTRSRHYSGRRQHRFQLEVIFFAGSLQGSLIWGNCGAGFGRLCMIMICCRSNSFAVAGIVCSAGMLAFPGRLLGKVCLWHCRQVLTSDAIIWCNLFVGILVTRSGRHSGGLHVSKARHAWTSKGWGRQHCGIMVTRSSHHSGSVGTNSPCRVRQMCHGVTWLHTAARNLSWTRFDTLGFIYIDLSGNRMLGCKGPTWSWTATNYLYTGIGCNGCQRFNLGLVGCNGRHVKIAGPGRWSTLVCPHCTWHICWLTLLHAGMACDLLTWLLVVIMDKWHGVGHDKSAIFNHLLENLCGDFESQTKHFITVGQQGFHVLEQHAFWGINRWQIKKSTDMLHDVGSQPGCLQCRCKLAKCAKCHLGTVPLVSWRHTIQEGQFVWVNMSVIGIQVWSTQSHACQSN